MANRYESRDGEKMTGGVITAAKGVGNIVKGVVKASVLMNPLGIVDAAKGGWDLGTGIGGAQQANEKYRERIYITESFQKRSNIIFAIITLISTVYVFIKGNDFMRYYVAFGLFGVSYINFKSFKDVIYHKCYDEESLRNKIYLLLILGEIVHALVLYNYEYDVIDLLKKVLIQSAFILIGLQVGVLFNHIFAESADKKYEQKYNSPTQDNNQYNQTT